MFRKARFEKLLEPFQIRGVKLRNRMVKPAQSMYFCNRDGSVNERKKAFYGALARGGVGLIIAGAANVDYPHTLLAVRDDKFIPGLSELAKVIHKHGGSTFLQLGHRGPSMSASMFGTLQSVAASSLDDDERVMPTYTCAQARELSSPEIEAIIVYFTNAAERAQKAGFDGVEIHAAHHYLLNSFLSRAWNKRQDTYGCQSLESRARFVVEIIQATKQRLGQDFPVGVRFNGGEWGVDKGITSEESIGFGLILQEAGADYLHVSGYGVGLYNDVRIPEMLLYPEPEVPLASKVERPGALVPRAEAVKKKVSIPVIAVGRLDPILGEWILRKGKADLIALGRRLLADPELPNKVASGKLEDIRPCIACLECLHQIRKGEPARCRVNAALGKEQEYAIKPAEKKKRVMIVGGGPAGMEIARVAALRGHEVALYEKGHKLGGLLPIAALVKGIEVQDLSALIRYLKTQITKLGVTIKLGKEVNPALIEEIKPDVIILAAGGIPVLPEIPGINRPNVVRTQNFHRMLKTYLRFFSPPVLRWLTKFWMPIGRRVVIMGGLIQGCELAEFMVKRGRKVTLVETSGQLGTGISDQHMERLLSWLAEKGATIMTEVKYEEITDKGLTITTKEGKKQTIEADTMLPAIPFRPNTELFKALEGKAPEVYLIGDCKEPRLIGDAIDDGSRIGCAI